MKQLIDESVLLLTCLCSLFFTPVRARYIIAFLAVVIFITANAYKNAKKLNLLLCAGYFLLALAVPETLLFLPVILYTLLWQQSLWALLPLLAVYIYQFRDYGVWPFILLALGTVIAVISYYRTRELTETEVKYRRTRDAGVEQEMILKEQNRALVTGRNYEIYNATLQERNRIAREIHDNVGHLLSRALLMTGALQTGEADPDRRQTLTELKRTLDAGMDSIRASVHQLYDDSLELHKMLQDLARDFTFARLELDYDLSDQVSRELKYAFLAIVKEGLTNVTKHSNATRVLVSLTEHPAFYQLVIGDNGTAPSRSRSGGIGLAGIRERVEGFGGQLNITKEEGFRIFISIPKSDHATDNR